MDNDTVLMNLNVTFENRIATVTFGGEVTQRELRPDETHEDFLNALKLYIEQVLGGKVLAHNRINATTKTGQA